ncbi:hypothetical protein RRF57_006610 [Xylaria bambusicola]|uniref:2EXR domain-containing protein n=1 Tax=Xylaria bambusicola TaxID=326684 RepID=A0AAN7UEP6_9PEZI
MRSENDFQKLGKAFQAVLKDIRCHTYQRMRKTRVKVRNKKRLKERNTDRRISYIKWKARYAQRMLRQRVTFKKFSSLPTEIRLQIWEQYVLTPRIIKVVYNLESRPYGRGHTIKMDGVKREQVCPLLLVSRESRYVALREPLILFGLSQFGKYHLRFAIRPHDIMFFEHNVCSWLFQSIEGDTSKIANIMFRWELEPDVKYEDRFMEIIERGIYVSKELRAWDNLENLYFLVDNPRVLLHRRWGWDDLHEVVPDKFPKYKDTLRMFPKLLRQYTLHTRYTLGYYASVQSSELMKVWKNVSVR